MIKADILTILPLVKNDLCYSFVSVQPQIYCNRYYHRIQTMYKYLVFNIILSSIIRAFFFEILT